MTKFMDVLNDPRLCELVDKIDSESGKPFQCLTPINTLEPYAIAGYHNGKPEVYFFDDGVDENSRHYLNRFGGFAVSHRCGTHTFECITDIQDGAKPADRGKWMIFCHNKGKTNYHWFENTPDLEKKKAKALSQIKGWVIVHQMGTNTYTLIDQRIYLPPSIESEETQTVEPLPAVPIAQPVLEGVA